MLQCLTLSPSIQQAYLREIEKLTKVRMLPLKPPSDEEALVSQLGAAKDAVVDLINKTDTEKFSKVAESLLAEYDAEDLVAALLNDVTKDDSSQVPVKITPERPLPRRGGKRNGGGYHRGGNGGGNNHRGGGNFRHRQDRRGGSDSRNHDSRNHGGNRNGNGSHHSNGNGGRRSDGGSRGFTIRKKD